MVIVEPGFGLPVLAGVAGEGDRFAARSETMAQILLQLHQLRIGESVHRVDNDRLNALATPIAQYVIYDWDDVCKALP